MLHKQPPRPDDARQPGPDRLRRPVPGRDLGATFETRFGMRLVEVYGMTEAPMACENRLDDRQDRLGGPRVDDLRGADRRRERRARAAGHARRDRGAPEALVGALQRLLQAARGDTVEAWRNLWFHTGDRGRDGRGRLPLLPRPDEGLHPPARREHLVLGGRVDDQHAPRRCSSRPPTASPPSSRSRT